MRTKLLSALVALLTVLAVLLAPWGGDGGEQPASTTSVAKQDIPAPIAVAVDGPDSDVKPDTTLPLDREAREIVQNATATPEQFDVSGGLRGEDKTPVGQLDGPLATPEFPGCTTRMLSTNWSNRTAPVRGVGLHYTAGANRDGLSDMNGLTAYANSPSAGVSWHFLIDAEGHCYYSVPLGKKAWTIGNLNSQTVNIEVIGTGKERSYPADTPGARKLAAVVRRIARIYDIPLRVGTVSNCVIASKGIITHWQGGACSGGHIDIKPYDLVAVVDDIANSGVTATDRATCRKLNWWRKAGRPKGKPEANAVRRKRALAKRGVSCTAKGPVK